MMNFYFITVTFLLLASAFSNNAQTQNGTVDGMDDADLHREKIKNMEKEMSDLEKKEREMSDQIRTLTKAAEEVHRALEKGVIEELEGDEKSCTDEITRTKTILDDVISEMNVLRRQINDEKNITIPLNPLVDTMKYANQTNNATVNNTLTNGSQSHHIE